MDIDSHFRDGFQSLVVIPIQKNMNAAKVIKLVEERLECFSLGLNKDVVAIFTDGASFMIKFGKETSPHHVTCYFHAIRLPVCDVLNKIPKYTPSAAVSDEINC